MSVLPLGEPNARRDLPVNAVIGCDWHIAAIIVIRLVPCRVNGPDVQVLADRSSDALQIQAGCDHSVEWTTEKRLINHE